jgi:uncharacterized membrane protein AbrB (regulator of aidB expression)
MLYKIGFVSNGTHIFFSIEPNGMAMDSPTAVGGGLLVVGLVGYVVGIYIPYPGRAFSLTAIMVGISVAAIAQSREER